MGLFGKQDKEERPSTGTLKTGNKLKKSQRQKDEYFERERSKAGGSYRPNTQSTHSGPFSNPREDSRTVGRSANAPSQHTVRPSASQVPQSERSLVPASGSRALQRGGPNDDKLVAKFDNSLHHMPSLESLETEGGSTRVARAIAVSNLYKSSSGKYEERNVMVSQIKH